MVVSFRFRLYAAVTIRSPVFMARSIRSGRRRLILEREMLGAIVLFHAPENGTDFGLVSRIINCAVGVDKVEVCGIKRGVQSLASSVEDAARDKGL